MGDFPPTIRVAVLGGGLAGVAVLRGLLKYPHIVADIYESRPIFRDELPAVQLSPTTQQALCMLDPALDSCLDRAGGVYSSTELRVSSGPDAGVRIPVRGFASRNKRLVGRQALLSQLMAGVPPRCIHVNARITSIDESQPQAAGAARELTLTFADGARKNYDVVVGADGVHGTTRRHVLGPDNPAVRPEPTGFWGLHVEVPLAKAQEEMGGLIDPANPCRVGWIGDGTFMLYNIVGGGREVQVVVGVQMEGTPQDAAASSGGDAYWAKLFTPDEFDRIFSRSQSPETRGMINLIKSIYTIQVAGIVQMQHPSARTSVTPSACLVGESAHAMLGFQGGGVVIAIEEALILSTLLGRVGARSDIQHALRAFDLVCRPRAEFAAKSSRETGLLCTGMMPGVGLDRRLLTGALETKWDFLHEIDLEAHRNRSIQAMDQLKLAARNNEAAGRMS